MTSERSCTFKDTNPEIMDSLMTVGGMDRRNRLDALDSMDCIGFIDSLCSMHSLRRGQHVRYGVARENQGTDWTRRKGLNGTR